MEKSNRPYENDDALKQALVSIHDWAAPEADTDFEQMVMQRMAAKKPGLSWMKMAASFIGILLLSGIAVAAVYVSRNHADAKRPVEAVQASPSDQADTEGAEALVIHFDNVPLDSLLGTVSRHYGKRVVYRNDSIRELRFLIEWNQNRPLSDFVTLINNFEGIHVSEEGDTIVAE